MNNRTGTYLEKNGYTYFKPLNLQEITINYSPEINNYLSDLQVLAKSYNLMLVNNDINYNIIQRAILTQEALLSSQIEGTQATLDDVFDYSNLTKVPSDKVDVYDYIEAVDQINNSEIPFSKRLIKLIHQTLMKNYPIKFPGEFRYSQNWIGGSNLNNAKYVPPHPSHIDELMTGIEDYYYKFNENPFIKTALLHYQFETIHPFVDGNGRVGRILIDHMLYDLKVHSNNSLAISFKLKQHQDQYYYSLQQVREIGNIENYLVFFLNIIKESYEVLMDIISGILKLVKLVPLKYKNFLFANPIFNNKLYCEKNNVSRVTASKHIKSLIDKNIIIEKSLNKKEKIYVFKSYIDLLKEL